MSTVHDSANLAHCVRTVKDPIIRPGDDDADLDLDLYEPMPADLDWWRMQDAGHEAAAGPVPAVLSDAWLAPWRLAEHVDQSLPFDAWLDAIAGQHEALVSSTAGRRYAWLARQVRGLARTARFLAATDPDIFDERDEVLTRTA